MAVGERGRRGWDLFVSYTQADRAWAEWIAWALEEDGYDVLVEAWDFVPGSNWVQMMQAGTRDSARILAVLSPAYLESVYGGAEWQAAWAADPDGAKRKLLVMRAVPCEPSGLLAGLSWTDLFGLGKADARARLGAAVRAAVTGRAKPAVPPSFPGLGQSARSAPRFPGALPRVWRVPARSPHFTVREEELAGLARVLAAGPAVTVQVVRGLGGVGKTQLAAEYAPARCRL